MADEKADEKADKEPLAAELIEVGRALRIEPVSEDLAADVLARIGSLEPRRRTPRWWAWLRARRRRLVAAVIIAVLLIAALTPPVRAAVLEWLRIGGVLITTGAQPRASTPGSPEPVPTTRPATREVTLEQARSSVDYPIGVPAALGAPDRVTITDDGRVVGMDWTIDGRPVHLDQLDGNLSYAFLKRHWSSVTPTEVDGADAAWLAELHEIVYVDRAGVERRETARLSGPSLVWQPRLGDRRTTARLEGIDRLDAARSIAESLE
jgi:hypothetical protein